MYCVCTEGIRVRTFGLCDGVPAEGNVSISMVEEFGLYFDEGIDSKDEVVR